MSSHRRRQCIHTVNGDFFFETDKINNTQIYGPSLRIYGGGGFYITFLSWPIHTDGQHAPPLKSNQNLFFIIIRLWRLCHFLVIIVCMVHLIWLKKAPFERWTDTDI